MTIREFTQDALKNLKGKPLKEKIDHILTYYWVPIVGCIIAVSLVGTMIYTAASRKETMLLGYCVNASAQETAHADLVEGFSVHAGFTEKQEMQFLANMSTGSTALQDTLQALTVHAAAQDVDFIASDLSGCRTFLHYGYYWDLSELPEQQQALLSPYFLYVERSSLLKDPSNDEVSEPPAFADKDALADPVAVALRLPASCKLSKAYRFSGGDTYMLLLPNSRHHEMLYRFLEYILQ